MGSLPYTIAATVTATTIRPANTFISVRSAGSRMHPRLPMAGVVTDVASIAGMVWVRSKLRASSCGPPGGVQVRLRASYCLPSPFALREHASLRTAASSNPLPA